MIVFVDDIMIYLRSSEEYEMHLRIVLHTLWEHCLYAKISKCEVWLSKVVFLGHVVSVAGIASYHNHRDLEFPGIGQILQEIQTGFLFPGNPSHMIDREGGTLHVDRCM